MRLFTAGLLLQVGSFPTCQLVVGWYRPEGQRCHLCPLNKLRLSIIPVSRACVQKGKCLQYEGASVSPSVARGGFRGNFERSRIWLGAQDVGGAQQTLLLFSLFIFFHPSSSNCASWATATVVLLLTFSSLKNTFKEFVGVCRTYHHAVW